MYYALVLVGNDLSLEVNGLSLILKLSVSMTTEINAPHLGHSISTFVPVSPLNNRRPHFVHTAYFILYNLLPPKPYFRFEFKQLFKHGRDNSNATVAYRP